jgi:uracil-DNA glycosylase family protein
MCRRSRDGYDARVARTTTTAEPFVPETSDLTSLAAAVHECRGCDLWEHATQAVFGEGSAKADVMLVGEVPGDQEDRQGRPFVGPAGRLLDEALAAAGIDRNRAYVTNAVKHFKWRERGKRRIHDKPSWSQIVACRPWLLAELAAVEPKALVLMGATAAQSVLGREVRVTRDRGKYSTGELTPLAEVVVVTIHPSAILRGEPEERETTLAGFVDDLRLAAR